MIHTIEVYFLLFMSYAVLGWIMEVICKLIQYKRFINRGFRIGPYCPIYGWGALLITILLQKYSNDPLVLFILAIAICSTLEYLTSYLMEKIFHARWWDYSTKKFNINGRICLSTMIPFGLLGVIVTCFINPVLFNFFNKINTPNINIIAITIFLIFLIDTIISVITLISIRKENDFNEKDNTEEISKKVKAKLKNLDWSYKRLLNAFPDFSKLNNTIQNHKNNILNNLTKEKIKYNEKQIKILEKATHKIEVLKKKYETKIEEIENNTNYKINKINHQESKKKK